MAVWKEEFSCLENNSQTEEEFLYLWNKNVIPWMEERGIEYKRFAHTYAIKRGFSFDVAKHAYIIPWDMKATSGKNLIGVGWKNGSLRCAFKAKGGERIYRSTTSDVPQEVYLKLLRSPYPDHLFTQIVKGKYGLERESG